MPVPIIAAGISAGASFLGNRKTAAEKAMEGTARQQGAMASQIAQMARQQHTLAGPALNKAMQHYLQLAGGNRAMLQSALGPEMNMMMDTYKGAEQGMLARMSPGPQRDASVADLARQKAGQMGTMGMTARNQAFDNLSGMGQSLMGMGNNMYGNAASVLGGQAHTQAGLADMARQRQQGWGALGQSVGSIFMPYLMGKFGGPGAQKPIPTMPNPMTRNINSGMYWTPGPHYPGFGY